MTLAEFTEVMLSLSLYDAQGIPKPTGERMWLEWKEYEMERERMQKKYSLWAQNP